ncbi:MAG: hypothetical protein LIP12_00815 [Clostridiales bacterium]|nr:hypothetical protein [Clostridiales bacterium]
MFDQYNPYRIQPGESDWLKGQRELARRENERAETKRRMKNLLEKAGGNDKTVRNNYLLTPDEQSALTEAKQKWDEEQKMGEDFVKAFTYATAQNGYALPPKD